MSDRHLPDSLVPSYLTSRKTSARLGLCPTMLYLLEKEDILKGVNVFGRKGYTLESILNFEKRAMAGEFARPPRGAAAKSQKKKREKEVNR